MQDTIFEGVPYWSREVLSGATSISRARARARARTWTWTWTWTGRRSACPGSARIPCGVRDPRRHIWSPGSGVESHIHSHTEGRRLFEVAGSPCHRSKCPRGRPSPAPQPDLNADLNPDRYQNGLRKQVSWVVFCPSAVKSWKSLASRDPSTADAFGCECRGRRHPKLSRR